MGEHIVGYVGCFFLSIFLVPQVYTTWTTQNVEGLSPHFLGTSMVANVLMIYYGVSIRAIPVIIANGSVLLNSVILLGLYVRYRPQPIDTEIVTKEVEI